MTKAPIDKLVMMSNQIAQFFGSYPREEGIAGIASHIEAFWTPKMVALLRAERHNAPKLDPLVVEAMAPAVAATSPAEKAHASPGKVGELGAVDAG